LAIRSISSAAARELLEAGNLASKGLAQVMSDYCPTLNAGLTILRPLVADHADALFPILRDVHLWRFTDQEPPKTLAGLRERYSQLENRRSPDGRELWLNWALERREDDRLVGFVQATVPISRSYANIAYVLGRAFWGRGVATDAVAAMLELLRAELHVRTARASVDSRNLPSVKLLERLGFRIEDATDPSSVWFNKSLLSERA
jgi:ribosomal-protein-alanine N-acetyltransferase